MKTREDIVKLFKSLGDVFMDQLDVHGIHTTIANRKEIINEGQRIQYIPILLKGSVKVYSLYDGKELLYYYIKPYDSCIMTFSAIFSDSISRIYACAEESCEVLLLPVNKVLEWIIEYPLLNRFFYREYDRRYVAIMDMVTHAVFHKLDKRILDLLQKKVEANGGEPIKISHKEIASTLGTAREVVSRILKKYENEGVISQANQLIWII